MRPLIIANWKMNPQSLGDALALARAVERGIRHVRNIEVVLGPPFPFLAPLRRALRRCRLAAQDAFWSAAGPYTGEVSPLMLKGLGVRYVLLGHSERRRIFGEDDDMINQKVKAVLGVGLTPVIAIGERFQESREVVPPDLARQLSGALAGIPRRRAGGIAVAYEPMWAISTMRGAHADTPDNATRRAIYIRKLLTKLIGPRVASKIRILYGGSVGAKNAAEFLAGDIRGMEGLLVGGVSLDAEEFTRIVESVARKRRKLRN